jgi:hypothetical protein
MGESEGFDDMFDRGFFRNSLHNTSRSRPTNWPRSVSEMRGLTSYDQQGLDLDAMADKFSSYSGQRPYSVHGPQVFPKMPQNVWMGDAGDRFSSYSGPRPVAVYGPRVYPNMPTPMPLDGRRWQWRDTNSGV